jgi:endonuclease I
VSHPFLNVWFRFVLSKTIALITCFVLFNSLSLLSQGQEILPGETGAQLRDNLRANYTPTQSLSYQAARSAMFTSIDNVNGEVVCVYTGDKLRTSQIPNPELFNTEHTWPQSQFRGGIDASEMKSDLHHLYVTRNDVNAGRGHSPFAEIPDLDTRNWWRLSSVSQEIPASSIEEYSESVNGAFEPREDHKGNAARSLLYFFTVYEERGIALHWFRPQIMTLLAWHELDPADQKEKDRSEAVASLQGNQNPFVVDSTLAYRIFQTENSPQPPVFRPDFFRARGRTDVFSRVTADGLRREIFSTSKDVEKDNEIRELKELIAEQQLEIFRLKNGRK